jgi:hypothetical protein
MKQLEIPKNRLEKLKIKLIQKIKINKIIFQIAEN